jgi:hypothetical protein
MSIGTLISNDGEKFKKKQQAGLGRFLEESVAW